MDSIEYEVSEVKNDECMLTTLDNPFSPFTQYEEWYSFDLEKGYDSCGLLARYAHTSDKLSSLDNNLEVNRAIDRIVSLLPTIYTKAYASDTKYQK